MRRARWSPSAGATADDIAGDPNYYVNRQAVYFVVGTLLAVVLARVDYSRLRGAKYGIYGAADRVDPRGHRPWARWRAARGARSTCGFFSFQASELGKVLLVVALAAFVVDRPRALHDRDTTVRVMLLALIPAALVMVQPDLGSGLVYVVVGLAVLFVAGTSWRHFAGALRARSRWPSPSPSWSRRRPA